MRQHRIFAAIIGAFVIAAGAADALAQPAPRAPACAAIRAACRQAGFVQGGAQAGEGIMVDCIAPIMRGVPQRRRASKPLPAVDPQLVAECRAQNPNFGQRNAPPGPAMAPPAQTIAPPAPTAAPPAPAIAPPAQPDPPAAAPQPTPWPVPAPRSESK
jgi:hypothetical protein